MSIGEVLDALRPQFPDVSVSKIRFLESEGLITPERSPSGYRRFATGDLDRLKVILQLQRDSFMPLKVIRKRLDQADSRGESPETVLSAPTENEVASPEPAPDPENFRSPPSPTTYTEVDLSRQTGLSVEQVRSLRDMGVLCTHQIDGQLVFDAEDVAIADAAKTLLSLGVDQRQLRTVRRTSDQQADVLELSSATPLRNPNPEAREQALDRLSSLEQATAQMRNAVVRARLRAIVPR